MTAAEALKQYQEAKGSLRTKPYEVQRLWEQYTQAVRREMEEKSDGESNAA